MQDPYLYSQFPEQEQLKCPRCDSPNTKFCYYNNYNLSQPRHFCKSCKRYWTKGGALRNIPVGGGSRKNAKRSSSSPAAANNQQQSKRPVSSSSSPSDASYGGQFGNLMDASGSFSSLLGGHGSNLAVGDHHFGGPQAAAMGSGNSNNDVFFNIHEDAGKSGCWSGGNGLPDVAMYTPASNFH